MKNLFALSVMVNILLNKYFQNSRCIFIFSENNYFDYNGNLSVVNINIINGKINGELIFRSFSCQGFLIHDQNTSDILIQIEEGIKLHHHRFNFRRYLILLPFQSNEEDSKQIFNLAKLQHIIDLLVIIPQESDFSETCDSTFKMLCKQEKVYKFVTRKHIGTNNNNCPKILDLWFSKNNSFLYDNDLYPDKITNQQGRSLIAATFTYEPYSIIEKSPLIARGSENNLAHEYAKYHNMNLQYTTDDNQWGIIYDNWTGNGIIGTLATGKADVGYGSVYSWEHEYHFLDYSKPTVRTGITCLVPAPRLAGGWLTPVYPFSNAMWLGTIISFVLASLIAIVLTILITKYHIQAETKNTQHNRKKKIDYQEISIKSFGSVFRIFLGQSLPFTNKQLTAAMQHMFVVFLFSVLLTSSYSSGLSTVMTVPRYEDSIETVLDLANSSLTWTGTSDAWTWDILNDKRLQYVSLVERFVTEAPENLIQLSETEPLAFPIERLPSGQYAIGSYVTKNAVKKLRLMHEDLYWEYCIMVLPKSSPLLESVDNFILRAFEAGLLMFWERRAAEVHMDLSVQNIVKYYFYSNQKKQEDTIKLKWIHVEGVFGILQLGLCLAFICFLAEIGVHRYKNRRVAVAPA